MTSPWVSIDKLLGLARLSRSSPPPGAERKIESIDDLGSIWQVQSSLNWMVPDLLAEGAVHLICSESGTGKTWLAYFLAGAVAYGKSVFGKEVAKRKVLYLDGENPAYLVKQRLLDLGIDETPDLTVWGGWHSEPPPRPDHPLIRQHAEKEKPLLIWDSLVQFHTGEEQSATETRRFMNGFRELAHLGATVVILHHSGKAETAKDYRGSSDIKAVVDMAFTLESSNKGTNLVNELTLRPFKSRLALVPTRLIKLVKGKGFESSAIIAQPVAAGPDPIEVIKEIVAANPGLNKTKIIDLAMAQGLTKHPAEETLKREDVFRFQKGRGHEMLCSLAEQPAPTHEEIPVEEAQPAPAQAETPAAEQEAA